ncbi:hypothetical protein PR048_009398 [Dryococelus australis]|uniref:Uncharacterized protein n=1 Tax=Dryococelus australis TaxID=614101 RepID=A0ABQ9HZV0_9NEOP|nr:hypothetical protein PR048_009398 [Dryococelus australis]
MKPLSTVEDTNFIKICKVDAVQFLDINVEEGTSDSCVVLPHHLRSASHTLNLLATTDFQKAIVASATGRIHHSAIGKCTTAIWNLMRQPKSSEVVTNILGCSLIYPCPTRWNSLYDSIVALMKHQNKLPEIIEKLGLTCNFNEAEVEYLQEYVEVTMPIALALDFLHSETNCFYGQLLPTLFSLKYKLQSVAANNLRYCAQILQNLTAALTKRFDEFFSLSPTENEAILASCFHPILKLR